MKCGVTETKMKVVLLLCILYKSCYGYRVGKTLLSNYIGDRQKLLEDEMKLSTGGKIVLSQTEIAANNILMKYKNSELQKIYNNGNKKYIPAKLVFANNSKVYHIIKSMPKGSAIQLERVNNMMLDIEFIMGLTYEDYLHACFYNDTVLFHFSLNIPQVHCPKDWVQVAKLRGSVNDSQAFDQHLKQFFKININETGKDDDLDIGLAHDKFTKLTKTLQSLITYRPVAEKHFYHMLQYFHLDNVRYLELRIHMQPLYELNGLMHNASFVASMYRHLIKKFIEEHPDFIGVKFIIVISRDSSIQDIRFNIELTFKLKKEFPELFAGIDVDGNKGKSLKEISRYFVELKDDLNFFFHAGETNWYGTSVDENLADAILLNSKRIGNAYSLVKHPLLMTIVKKKSIAVEISVISNAVHGLVKDFRNHPAATYLACGLPVILSSDNPGLWGVDPLSHDFYVTFMAIASRHADLRLLKQLALNSIQYSSLDNMLKTKFLKSFYTSWNVFVKNVLKTYPDNGGDIL